MPEPLEYEYTVLLVTPYYGDSRENAERILEAALDWLNTFREEPGFRFHPTVSATLDVVSTVEQAAERLEDDDSLAMIIFHDASEDEQLELLRECERRNVGACVTIPSPDLEDEEDDQPQEWKLVVRSRAN